jgi:NADH-quinone oxidoreductase subunit J
MLLAQAVSDVGYRDTNATEVIFILLGLVAIGSAVLVVTTRNVVRAALWLVVTLAAAAGSYLLLAAEFVAWVQVLIYVGAVVVLLLFGIMLTKAPIGREQGLDGENRIAGGIVALASAATLVTLMVDAFRNQYVDLHGGAVATTARTGEALFQAYVLPFEVVSVLLLAALIGSIALSRQDDEGVR